MTNNMASSGLQKISYLPIFILITHGTIGCVMSGTWWQMVWHLAASAVPYYLSPGATQHTTNGAMCDKYKYW